MDTGTVKWFNDQKGFGFITPDVDSNELFVHHADLFGDAYNSLVAGAKVTYDPQAGPKGPRAFNVTLV